MKVNCCLVSLEDNDTFDEYTSKFKLICTIVNKFIIETKRPQYCVLDSNIKPDILVSDYIIMVIQKTKTRHPLLYLCHAIIYMARYLRLCNFQLTAYNAHRLFLTTLLLTTKQLDDCAGDANVIFAKEGGVSLKEMNLMECHVFDILLLSHLHVSYDDIKCLYRNLSSYSEKKKIKNDI